MVAKYIPLPTHKSMIEKLYHGVNVVTIVMNRLRNQKNQLRMRERYNDDLITQG